MKENVAYDESDSVTDIIDDMEDHDKEEEKDEDDDGPQMLTRQAIEESLQKPAKKRDLESNLHIERNSENLVEHQAMDSAQPLKGNPDFNVTEDNEKQIEQEGSTYTSKPIAAEDNLNKTEDRKNELSSVQSEVSYVIYSSSSPSSPTSTQIEPMKIEEVSSSDLNQEIDIDVPQSNLEDLVKSSSLDEQPLDDTSLIMPQNVKHLVDDSSSHLSNTGDFNILEVGNRL